MTIRLGMNHRHICLLIRAFFYCQERKVMKGNKISSGLFTVLQKLGPALVSGIAIAPLGGIMLGIGSILTNTTIVGALPFLGSGVFAVISSILHIQIHVIRWIILSR